MVRLDFFQRLSLSTIVGRILPSTDGDWIAFWWYDVGTMWPSDEKDVLAYDFGYCEPRATVLAWILCMIPPVKDQDQVLVLRCMSAEKLLINTRHG